MHPRAAADPEARRKARGAFFTPPELCRYMAEWAIRAPSDRVLEPSCGEAAFLAAAAARLGELGATPGQALRGIELHEPSARAAREALRAAGLEARPRRAPGPGTRSSPANACASRSSAALDPCTEPRKW